jgi:hypothetical protein
MTFGAKIFNPGNELVVSADSATYYYAGLATLYSTTAAASNHCGSYTYKTTLPAGSKPPMFFVELKSGAVINITDVFGGALYGYGNDWYVNIDSVAISGSTSAPPSQTMVVPTVYVYAPAIAPTDTYGCMLYLPTGEPAVDFTRRPLFMRAALNFSAVSDTGPPFFDDSVSLPVSISKPAIFGNCSGEYFWADTYAGVTYKYGWALYGGSLHRYPYFSTLDASMGADDGEVSGGVMSAATALLVEAINLV